MQRAPDVSSGLQSLGRGVQNVGEAIDQIDLKQAQTQAFDAENKITSDWLAWDAENRSKFRGENVEGYAPAAKEWWAKSAEAYGKDLSPRARELVSKSLMAKQTAALGNVVSFTAAERDRHADDVAAANIDSTIQFGVSSGKPEGAAQQVRQIAAQVGARKGWTTEQVQDYTLKNLSALHLGQIASLAETNAQAAQAYYDANKGEISAPQQARVEKVIKGEADNQSATKFAAENATLPLAEQLKKAGEITDPELRTKTLQQVKLNHAVVREAQAEQERQASDQAWQLVGQGKRAPESILAGMDGHGRVQLQDYLKTRAERLSKGGSIKTDWELYNDLREQIRTMDPDERTKFRLNPYSERLAGPQIEQLNDLLDKARKGPDAMTQEQQLSAYIAESGIEDKKAAGQFKSAYGQEVNAFIKDKKREPSFDERQVIMDQLTKDVVVGTKWFGLADDTEPAYKAPADKRNPDKFNVGQVYKDGKGNRAKYLGNGKWESM